MTEQIFKNYRAILEQELIPAMGCTEPIALAYAAAKGRELLEELPDRVLIQASGSIIKNTKSVVVPNTGHMRGIPAAVAAGIVGGHAELELEVLSKMTEAQIEALQTYLTQTPMVVEPLEDGHVFDIFLTLSAGAETAQVRITDYHTNIVYLCKNGQVLLDKTTDTEGTGQSQEGILMTMEDIWTFANEVDLDAIRPVIQRQIDSTGRLPRRAWFRNTVQILERFSKILMARKSTIWPVPWLLPVLTHG